MIDEHAVATWVAQHDPALGWQVARDVWDEPEAVWRPIRAEVETVGLGAHLLSLRDADGRWSGGSFLPEGFTGARWEAEGQPWSATCWAITQLREFGLDPQSTSARETVYLVGENARWDNAGQPYWSGEVEECINGRTVADGAYFGVDMRPVVDRLITESLPDGGWNCERCNGSTRSSFATTINVLEGLLEFECSTGGTSASHDARKRGEEYLLARRLYRRASTGAPADEQFLSLTYPSRWMYDILRGLDYFRAASRFDESTPDPRLRDAIEALESKRDSVGRWCQDWSPGGETLLDLDDGPGRPSRWITLRALRVLRWWNEEPDRSMS